MNLSGAYHEAPFFYVVSYEDGHGTIELTSKTFTCVRHAKEWIAKNEHTAFWCDHSMDTCANFRIHKASFSKEKPGNERD